MDELIAVTVVIGDRNYRLKLNPTDEEIVRQTMKTVNEKIVEYKTAFAGKDMQDYIAMVLIWLATQNQPGGAGAQAGLLEELANMEKSIDRALGGQ